jgi:hypothetical protein
MLLPEAPLLVQQFLQKVKGFLPLAKFLPLTMVCTMFIIGGIVAYHVTSINDNPEAYSSLPQRVVISLDAGLVHYANDGSALYELSKFGVRFSNAGQEMQEVPHENSSEYVKCIMIENASFVLAYGNSLEENLIENLGWPLVFQENDLEIWSCKKLNLQILSPRILSQDK